MNLIKQLFCKHKFKFIRNIYGDEINLRNGNRSEWKCEKCGKTKYQRQYVELNNELHRLTDTYYINQQDKWIEDHKSELDDIVNRLKDAAESGQYGYEFVMTCDDDYLYRYEKFIKEKLYLKIEVTTISQNDTVIKDRKIEISWI